MLSDARRLWVIAECYPRPGAVHHCAFIHRQMVGLRQAGWDVNVLVPGGWFPPCLWRLARAWRVARRQRIPDGWALDGIPVSTLSYQNRVPSRLCRPPDAESRITAALVRHLRRAGAIRGQDVLLAQFALPYGPVARRAARELDVPYAVCLRGDDVWVHPHRGEKKMTAFVDSLAHADLVLAVCQSLLDEAGRLVGRPIPRAAVVANGIDLNRFRASAAEREARRRDFGLAPEEVAVLCVGDALRRKGWSELLGALGGPRAGGGATVLLAVTGKTEWEIDLPAEAARLAPDVRLRLLPHLSHDALAEVYRAADVFCLLSHWEGIANALLEALASGLPVVTTSIAGHPEVVTDGVEGYLVPPKSPDAAREALRPLIESPALRADMGRAARRRAEAVGDSAAAGARLARLLDGVLEGTFETDLACRSPYAIEMPPGTRSAAPCECGVSGHVGETLERIRPLG
jgi:glycosyltransferase involved in cell wall biosynthesis